MFRIILFAVGLSLTAIAQEFPVMPIFNPSMMTGMVGNTATRLYLAPSPVISMGAVKFINAATNTLDVCVYELDRAEILEAFVAAHERGVKVRIAVHEETIVDKDHEDVHRKFERLKSLGILRVTRPKSGLMHNKFMVADAISVWTGSYNFSVNDTEMNDNNAVTFANSQLAANYKAEMEEIWNSNHGKKLGTPTPHPEIQMGDVTVRNLFSPEDDVETAISDEILKATNSIFIMAFALTDKAIYEAITNRIGAGVTVLVLLDLTLSRQRTSLGEPLTAAGAKVRISTNNGRMHHKVIVIDDNVVITGSANFSASAFDSNDENIVIFGCPPLARAFKLEFARSFYAQPYWVNKWQQQHADILQRLNQLTK